MIRKIASAALTFLAVAVGIGWTLSELLPMNPDCGRVWSFYKAGWHLHPSSTRPVDLCISGYDGKLHVEHVDPRWQNQGKWRREFAGMSVSVSPIYDNCFGEEPVDTEPKTVAYASIPFAYITLTFSLYPAGAFFFGPLRRWRRRRKGLCSKCGYDLTGNESGTCPECGKTV